MALRRALRAREALRRALVSLGLAGARYGAHSGAFPTEAALRGQLPLPLLLLLLQIHGAIIVIVLVLLLLSFTEPALALVRLALRGAIVVSFVKLKGHRGHRHPGRHG